MTQFASWVLFPAVLVLLSGGCGLLLEWLAGLRLAEALLLPMGLAVVINAGEVMTKVGATARFTTPVVVALAVIGVVVTRPWRRRPRLGRWPVVAAVAVYVVYLAPAAFTGEPTFTGYVKLDDTATWMAMIDGALNHGHDLAGLSPSTYEATLHFYLNGGEPIGALLPWGIGHQLVAQDVAWVFQPYMAFLGGMLALAAWPIATPLVRARPLRAIVVFIAAQSALLFGYSLWGGIKEVAAAAVLPLIAAGAITVFEQRARLRSLLPLAMAALAMLSVLAYGGAVWLVVTLAVVAVFAFRVWLRTASRRVVALLVIGAAGVAALLIRGGLNFIHANGALTGEELGNLLHPLNGFQLFGVWPTTDFRVSPPDAQTATYVLVALVIAAGCVALTIAWRRRAWALWLYLGAGVVGIGLVSARGSPWVQGKALAIASPAVLLAGLAGAAVLFERRAARVVAILAVGAIAGGVLWSNVLAYHHVTLAPYSQFRELQQIGDRFSGEGPTLVNEYQPYAARHFLRNMDPESPSELRRRVIPLASGGILTKGGYADLDAFQIPALLVYRTIVIRTAPAVSRPPQPYRLVYTGRWYQVWQRPLRPNRTVVSHLALGDSVDPTAVPSCHAVVGLARAAGPGGLLAAASRPSASFVTVAAPLPTGETNAAFVVTTPGLYELWLGGSFFRRLITYVDGVRIGSIHEQLNESGQYTPLGQVRLGVAAHRVTLSYGDAGLYPGSGGPGKAGPFFPVGPLALGPVGGSFPLRYVAASRARSLCGKRWDWIEALAG